MLAPFVLVLPLGRIALGKVMAGETTRQWTPNFLAGVSLPVAIDLLIAVVLGAALTPSLIEQDHFSANGAKGEWRIEHEDPLTTNASNKQARQRTSKV